MPRDARPRHGVRRIAAGVLAFALGATLSPLGGPPAIAGKAKRVAVFRGMGAWVDIFDDQGWADPEGTVLALQQQGVKTLYLQTCNYRCKEDIHRPTTVSRWIDAAHGAGMKVVAWYLPGFEKMALDERRSRTALDFQSSTGQRFDGFALDIEAREVDPVKKRNRRMLDLSRRIRNAAGGSFPLAAITIPWWWDWGAPFPYAGLDRIYDVFMPMVYFGYRSNGPKGARANVAKNIQEVRRGTGRRNTLVHPIGGIANDLNAREVGTYVRTSERRHAIGVSLYDHFTSGPEDYEKLRKFR
ncbi:MAG: hypothetical protein ACRDJP_08845 [Actinomycetota bacterium]